MFIWCWHYLLWHRHYLIIPCLAGTGAGTGAGMSAGTGAVMSAGMGAGMGAGMSAVTGLAEKATRHPAKPIL